MPRPLWIFPSLGTRSLARSRESLSLRGASVGGTSESGRYVANRPFVLPTR